MNIILGSASPRRKEILSRICTVNSIISPDINEDIRGGENASSYALRLSREKSFSIVNLIGPHRPALLITSDTVVALDKMILGKPFDYNDAASTLKKLGGRGHKVITALTLSERDTGQTWNYFRLRVNRSSLQRADRRRHWMLSGAYWISWQGRLLRNSGIWRKNNQQCWWISNKCDRIPAQTFL